MTELLTPIRNGTSAADAESPRRFLRFSQTAAGKLLSLQGLVSDIAVGY